ncbi:MAG: anhydro-N-acetylmuramic acid kinase [Ahrensia sp.]|nr:anhydro-N-acetylmuramic acid kinase [Ahrensia sp.]
MAHGTSAKPVLKALGLMSGTSMDGIDLALIETDGDGHAVTSRNTGMRMALPYEAAFSCEIEAALEDAKSIVRRDDRPGRLTALEKKITQRHADAVNQFIKRFNVTPDILGFHGQTVLHRPEEGLTVQLGDGQQLADLTGIRTVYDMRAADIIAGGQGAPLVPIYHRVLARAIRERPVAFVNVGGIANITYVGRDGALLAFDTGPGNALIDQWVSSQAGIPYDQGGKIAGEGVVVREVVDRYMAADFFSQTGPKSLDRNDFEPLAAGSLELSDGARTLTRVTAEAIMAATEHVPEAPRHWVLCGGGRLNDTLMRDLKDLAQASDATVSVSEELGFDGDMMEAEAFAYLAVRSLHGLPLTEPGTTGCSEPVTGGVVAEPHQP